MRLTTFFFLLTAIVFFSCKPEGCTNACAYNYNKKAEKDDGSCVLKKPKVSFYSNGNSHGYINIAIDGNQNGTIEIGEYFGTLAFGFNSQPYCGQYNTVTHEMNEGTYKYRAWASDDNKIWEGSFKLTNCNCTLVLLED